jgi:hypothetical protein
MQLKTSFRQKQDEAEFGSAQEVGYERWRRASPAIAGSYLSWEGAPSGERFLAHDYVAALEREEDAARTYQHLVEQGRAGTGRS